MDGIIIFVSVLFCLIGNSQSYEYQEKYFTQKIDHFSYTNRDNFQQRYLTNFEFYDPCIGNIFFYTGNEGDITIFANNTGFMWEIAHSFNAALIFAEHRYYGKSLPYGKLSTKNNKHRGYLSSEQALADFASLIHYLKTTLKGGKEASVITFGGSYGGMLSAWIRMKYPHLVDGAIASSAPILMFPDMTPCEKFAETVTDNFKQEGISCSKSIRRSWDSIRKLGKSAQGINFLKKTFLPCDSLGASDIDTLVNWLGGTWEFMAMTNYPYPTNFLKPIPAYPVKEACKFLKNDTVDDKLLILNVFKAASVFHNFTKTAKCNDLDNPGGSSLGGDLWDYQVCTEMVQSLCRTGKTDMFEPSPYNFTELSEACLKQWDVKPDPENAYLIYGGKNITASSNIVFSNGKLDPWSPLGVLESLSDSLIAIVIDGAAHHLDLRSSNPADPIAVIKARQAIIKSISLWISKPGDTRCS